MLRLGDVDLRASRLDDDGFAEAADVEGQRADREPLAGAEDDVLALERAEAGHLDPNGVAAGLQVGDLKAAVSVADRHARVVGRLVDDGERRAGNDLPLRVGDVARDGAADGLGGRGAGEQDDRRAATAKVKPNRKVLPGPDLRVDID